MNKTLPTLRYLSKGFSWMIFVGFFSMVAAVVVSFLIYQFTSRNNPVQESIVLTLPSEITAGVFAILLGTLLFLITLKVAVANGVSRKTFLKANLLAALASAAALSLFNLLLYLVHQSFWPAVLISQLSFPQIGLAGVVVVQTAMYFLLIVAGWLVTLAYARGNTLSRWIISLAPFALYAVLRLTNARSDGTLFDALRDFHRVAMSTPLGATITLAAYAAIGIGVVYLLLRRAPVSD